jgi:uncharacterized protein (DUF1697 family)
MARYAALLRGVNVGGSTQVSMRDLRERLTDSGFSNVRTLLQSGNVVFEANARPREEIERRIEEVISRSFARSVDCFVRSDADWRRVIDGNPFSKQAAEDPGRMTVLLLKRAPAVTAWQGLQASIAGREITRGQSDHGYVVYPDGQGRSKVTLDRIERALGSRGTIRNWNTVGKIASLLNSGTTGTLRP